MIKFGELVDKGMASFKVNPVTQAYAVIIHMDKLSEEYVGNSYTINVNDKEYEITDNKFNETVKSVTLDTNRVTEEQLKDSVVNIIK